MKAGGRVVEFIDQGGRPYGDGQAGFLHHLALQVFGQGGAGICTATRGAPQIGQAAGIGIDDQKPVLMQDQGTDGEAG